MGLTTCMAHKTADAVEARTDEHRASLAGFEAATLEGKHMPATYVLGTRPARLFSSLQQSTFRGYGRRRHTGVTPRLSLLI